MGRLTVDELDERTALAYGAVTRGELAELLDDLPVPRDPGAAPPAPRRGARRGLPWFPGRLRVHACAGSPRRTARQAQTDLMEFVAPPMHRFGYDLVERTPERLVFERRTSPMWTLLPAIFLFPIGLLALLTPGQRAGRDRAARARATRRS